jgi:hypothetical protein
MTTMTMDMDGGLMLLLCALSIVLDCIPGTDVQP